MLKLEFSLEFDNTIEHSNINSNTFALSEKATDFFSISENIFLNLKVYWVCFSLVDWPKPQTITKNVSLRNGETSLKKVQVNNMKFYLQT